MDRLPPLQEALPDFRTSTPAPRAKRRETIEAIKLAEGIQRMLRENQAERAARFPAFSATADDAIEKFALKMREHFAISLEDQRGAKDARQFCVTVRRKIEDLGIVVLQDSFPQADGSGFCLADPKLPVILVNTKKQTRGAGFSRSPMSLHMLMGRSGISDPAKYNNAIERHCNRLATSFLVPASFVAGLLGTSVTRNPDLDDVKFTARKLKISQESAVLRLEQLNYYKAGSHSKWKALVSGNNLDFAKEGGGSPDGKPSEQEKVKLARFGFRFARTFKSLLDLGFITELSLYRASGLKPKYQRAYFDYVASLSSDELQNLELDDGYEARVRLLLCH